MTYGIQFKFGLFCEYSHLECVRIHVISRVNQAEYGIHVCVVAPQKYVNIHSTRRILTSNLEPRVVSQSIKGPHKATHGQHKPYPSTTTEGSKPCVTK